MSEVLYNIEKVLDRKKVNGRFEYKIKWEGYPLSQSTWEPMKNLLNAKALIDEYDKAHPVNITNTIDNTKTKENSFANKKKKINDGLTKTNQENDDSIKNKRDIDNDENSNILFYENENSYKIDDTLKSVVTVKNQNGKLMAIVDKVGESGEIIKTYIPTEELRKINPWILLNFYESKIKFT